MDRATAIWAVGLCLVAAAVAFQFAGIVAAVGTVGAVLFGVGLAADLTGGG